MVLKPELMVCGAVIVARHAATGPLDGTSGTALAAELAGLAPVVIATRGAARRAHQARPRHARRSDVAISTPPAIVVASM
jgi:hypothetical protein